MLGGVPFTAEPGVARRLVTFLLLRQKKTNEKKRRPPVRVPTLRYGQPAVLDYVGGKNNSPVAQTGFPLDADSISAPRRGQKGLRGRQKTNTEEKTALKRFALECSPNPNSFPTPLRLGRAAQTEAEGQAKLV